jgi:hypothetical protein
MRQGSMHRGHMCDPMTYAHVIADIICSGISRKVSYRGKRREANRPALHTEPKPIKGGSFGLSGIEGGDTVLDGIFRQSGNRMNVELLHDVGAVGLDGLFTDVQVFGNGPCGGAVCQ